MESGQPPYRDNSKESSREVKREEEEKPQQDKTKVMTSSHYSRQAQHDDDSGGPISGWLYTGDDKRISAQQLQAEWVRIELQRLETAQFHLRRSMDELKEADPNDPDILEALAENEAVLQKQQTQIEKLKYQWNLMMKNSESTNL
jgi:hypothetical protein